MNKYLIHVDTAEQTMVTAGPNVQASVSKVNGNPFQCTVILGNRHRAIREVKLKNVQMPVAFYNIRAPYNTMNVNSIIYTITPGNYTADSLRLALNSAYGPTVGTFSIASLTNIVTFASASGSATMNVTTPSILSVFGFAPGVSIGTTIVAPYSYLANFDTYVSIWIENLGPSSLEPSPVTFKVPITAPSGSIMHWTENTQDDQVIRVTDRGVRLDRLNIQVIDRFGTIINNNGVDWSFTLEILADT